MCSAKQATGKSGDSRQGEQVLNAKVVSEIGGRSFFPSRLFDLPAGKVTKDRKNEGCKEKHCRIHQHQEPIGGRCVYYGAKLFDEGDQDAKQESPENTAIKSLMGKRRPDCKEYGL